MCFSMVGMYFCRKSACILYTSKFLYVAHAQIQRVKFECIDLATPTEELWQFGTPRLPEMISTQIGAQKKEQEIRLKTKT